MKRGRLVMPREEADGGAPDAALIRWYRNRGRQWLPNRLRPWAARMGLTPAGLDVHELAHIPHPQHTPGCWATVERAMPDYERRKSDLVIVGAGLWLG